MVVEPTNSGCYMLDTSVDASEENARQNNGQAIWTGCCALLSELARSGVKWRTRFFAAALFDFAEVQGVEALGNFADGDLDVTYTRAEGVAADGLEGDAPARTHSTSVTKSALS